MRLLNLHGAALLPHIASLAALRIAVFRDWPYLYDGSLAYEQDYLAAYAQCPQSLVVLALDGDTAVGASTAQPLEAAQPEWQAPFIAQQRKLADYLYFGESVVLAPYRGRGLGVAFFAAREAHAQQLGLAHCSFCAVDRPVDHPARPAGYRGNEAFWAHRGYQRQPELCTQFTWQDLGESQPTAKAMTFWLKTLARPC